MTIKILSSEVASQIAAGEVVERPAAVVKELIENSIDAGATSIQVVVENGGKKVIEVADDGSGIPPEELELAVSRHATSKLQTADDLFNIKTLGFRGEALASICSVSRTVITSRFENNYSGARIVVDGGKIQGIQEVGVPRGTTVRVEQLFYNVPARLKFLKTERTEKRIISEFVTKYALAYPEIRFSLSQDNRVVLQTSGSGDRKEALGRLFGVDIAKKMIPVFNYDNPIEISGFVSPITVSRANRKGIHFFVNGRPITDAALTAAVIKAYHTFIMVGRFPMAVIFIKLPPELVDVNVHPTKAEVRFREKDRVFRDIGRSVRKALLASSPVQNLQMENGKFSHDEGDLSWMNGKVHQQTLTSGSAWWFQGNENNSGQYSKGEGEDSQTSSGAYQQEISEFAQPLLRLIGQIAATYIVAEGPDGLYLVDQHAAHERILFEKFLQHKNEEIPVQRLLQPVTIDLSASESILLNEQLPVIRKLGFDIEPFGRSSFIIRAVPDLLKGIDPVSAIRVLVDDFEEDETPLEDEIEKKIVARICKGIAVKGGQVLSKEEQQRLLMDLQNCQSPRTCPHGRPTMIHLSVDLLERQFGRRGPR